MLRLFAILSVLTLFSGCILSFGKIPLSNVSQTQLSSANFKVVRTGLQGEASCTYLLGFIPLTNPSVATKAMDQLVLSAGSEGKSIALANFAIDMTRADYPFVSFVTVKVRADAIEFTE